MQISPSIHSLPRARGAFTGFRRPNVYLVVGDEPALIDSGYGSEVSVRAYLDYLDSLGLPKLSYIVITHSHPDHLGGAQRLREITGAAIVTHPLEAPAANRVLSATGVDKLVEDGDTIEVGDIPLVVIHTPGHSPGHLCLYIKDRGVLFSGDNIPGTGTTVITPPQGEMGLYINSLRRLLNYDIELICPGHGPLIKEPKRKIRELIEHRLEREEQVLTCLKQGLGRVEELVKEIYPKLDSRLYQMARDQVLAHLIKLEREGKVIGGKGDGEYKPLRC